MNPVHIFILNLLIENNKKNADNIGVVHPKW